MKSKQMSGLCTAHKRFWHNKGVQDARQSLSASKIDIHLVAFGANYYLPEHYADARKYYMLGFRRTGHRLLMREHYQKAGIVG